MRLVATLPATVYRPDAQPARLPAANDAQPVANEEAARSGVVLVVEDESLIALELCDDLESQGWVVVGPAATIEEAIRLLAKSPSPDVAILDVNLGGVMVYPLADRLRAQGVPLVFCTGYEQLEDHARYADCPLVRKPVNMRLLADELHRVRPAA
jgi:CheY-like chemotaxis protein